MPVAAFRSPKPRQAGRLSCPRWRPFCAIKKWGRWRAFAPRLAGPLLPKSPSSSAKKTATGNWSLILATPWPTPRAAKSWTFQQARTWGHVPNAPRRCLSWAKTMCAKSLCLRQSKPHPAATSRAARSSCNRRWSPSKSANCWPPVKPICWTSLCPCAPVAPLKRFWPGTKTRAK